LGLGFRELSKVLRTQSKKASGYKNLIAIVVIAVCVYFGFDPLFERVNGGVEGAVVGASFGAIFVIILTMYLLNKQTEIEQDSKRGEKVFEEKVDFYRSLLRAVREIVSDGKIDAGEVNAMAFALVELQMVGADETIRAYLPVLNKCNDVFHGSDEEVVEFSDEDAVELMTLLSKFSQRCRVDLGIDEYELDPKIFDRAVAEMTEGVTRKVGNKEYFDGLSSKLQQLKDWGCNEDGIEAYRILTSFLNDKAKGDERYRINLAKSGSAFYDSKAKLKQQLYLANPQKRSVGVGFTVKEGSGVVDEIRDRALGIIGRDSSPSIRMVMEIKGRPAYDCFFHPALADEMGVGRYQEFLTEISPRIYEACEARG